MNGPGPDRDVLTPLASGEDLRHEASLRPRTLPEFVGQGRVVDNLGVYLEAARRRGKPPDHVLLAGPPGLGKTSLAHIIAAELGSRIHMTSGPAIERPGDLAALLTHLEPGDVLFVDEIHRLGTVVEEVLYPAMEDFGLDLTIGQGPGARSVRIDLPPFTLVGATTRSGLLSAPLRDRFGIVERLGVDGLGLDGLDRRLLALIVENYGGGPVGLGTLAAALGEEPDTLEEVSEPFLIQIGLLERTPRGRCATERARRHLGFEPGRGPSLFP
jgi:Holliday junction DNA helicase RuvB